MERIKIKDGWLVCAKCGKKLANLLPCGDIEIKCRDSRCGEKNIIDKDFICSQEVQRKEV